MKGRPPKNFNPNAIVTYTVTCPNCQMKADLQPMKASEYNPPYFMKCGFCDALIRWSKSKAVEVIPSSVRYQIMIEQSKKENNKQ